MSYRTLWVVLAAFVVLPFLGCGTTDLAAESVRPGDVVLDDQWDTLLIAGAKIGYVHTVTRRVSGDVPVIVTSIFSEMGIKRMGIDLSFRTFVEQREMLTGEVISALSETQGGAATINVSMEVRDGKALITTRLMNESRTTTVAWDPEVLGPYAQATKMRQAGFKPGEKIECKVFEPTLQRVTTCVISVEQTEIVRIRDKEMALTRATMTQSAFPGVKTTVWLDERGDVVRSMTDAVAQMETLRCTREEALSSVVPADVIDVMDQFVIRTGHINDRDKVRNALYRLKLPADAAKLLSLEDRRQSIEERGEGFVLLRVRATGDAPTAAARPGPEFLTASPYIQCDDAEIIKAAREAAGDGSPAEKARRIDRWVNKAIAKKDYRVSFASAKEVLISREGDCTEHAVLMAGLLRAVGIPSRVAVGVVYWKDSFAYHMWTEAFLNDWTAFDPTLREDVVDATHIKLGSTALETSAASDAFLALVQVIGKLKIDIVQTAAE